MTDALQASLIELLRAVPADARAEYEHGPCHHSFIPYGSYCERAADEIVDLRRELSKARNLVSVISPAGHEIDYDGWTSAMEQIGNLRERAEKAEAANEGLAGALQREQVGRLAAEAECIKAEVERDRYLAAIVEWTEASVGMDYAIASVYGNRTVDQESPEAKKTIEDARIRLRASKDALRRIAEEKP